MDACKERPAKSERVRNHGRTAKRGQVGEGQNGADVWSQAPVDQDVGQEGGEQSISGGAIMRGIQEGKRAPE